MDNTLRYVASCILVFLLQVLVANHIDMGPYIFISLLPLILMHIPASISDALRMLIAFALGLLLDIMTDGVTGLHAGAATALGALCGPIYRNRINTDWRNDSGIPTIRSIGPGHTLYAIVASLIYTSAYILLECVTFRPFWFILLRILISTAVSALLTVIIGRSLFRGR